MLRIIPIGTRVRVDGVEATILQANIMGGRQVMYQVRISGDHNPHWYYDFEIETTYTPVDASLLVITEAQNNPEGLEDNESLD